MPRIAFAYLFFLLSVFSCVSGPLSQVDLDEEVAYNTTDSIQACHGTTFVARKAIVVKDWLNYIVGEFQDANCSFDEICMARYPFNADVVALSCALPEPFSYGKTPAATARGTGLPLFISPETALNWVTRLNLYFYTPC